MTSTALRHWSLDWEQTLAVREEEKKEFQRPGPDCRSHSLPFHPMQMLLNRSRECKKGPLYNGVLAPISRFLGLLLLCICMILADCVTETRHLCGLLDETPEAFRTVRGGVVLLPEIIKGGEEENVLGELGYQAVDGDLLVLLAGDGGAVGGTLPWPATLSDDDLLATTGRSDTLRLLEHKLAGLLGSATAVEESVRIGSGVIGALAELGVGNHGDKGVDSDHRTRVASGIEDRTGRVDSGDDGRDTSTSVDELVADGNGVNGAPVTLDGGDDLVGLGLDRVDVEDTDKQLHTLGSGGGLDRVDLVTVGAIDTNHSVAVDLGKVGSDLILRLAGSIIVVWRVHDALAGRTTWSGLRLVRRRSRALFLGSLWGLWWLDWCRSWRCWWLGGGSLWWLWWGLICWWRWWWRIWFWGRGRSTGVVGRDGVSIAVHVDNGARSGGGHNLHLLVVLDGISATSVSVATAVDLGRGDGSQGRDGKKTSFHDE